MNGPQTGATARPAAETLAHLADGQALAVSGGSVLGAIAALLALDQLLLLVYLGIAAPMLVIPGLVGTIWLTLLVRRGAAGLGAIPLTRFALCLLAALIVLVLGGEGRLFYANIDWQVRDAVLRDMAVNPWPFAYVADGTPTLLRAPIGMYLLPALAWKAGGTAAGTAVLILQNTALLGGLLALGSVLFETARDRLLGLVTMLAFGGLDVVGNILSRHPMIDHLDGWSPGLQFSSTMTLAFWVPQHAFAGWIAGLLYMLHRTDRIRLGTFLAIIPLTALWSPLAMIGALPWAALASVQTLMQRQLRTPDILVPALATLLVVPGLAFLAAAGDDVGIRPYFINPRLYLLCIEMEVLPWMFPALALRARSPFGVAAPVLATAVLVAIPFVQIGWSIDFMMRGSIPSQTVLGLIMADSLARTPHWRTRGWHWFIAVMLCLASVTGLHEIRRAITLPAVGGGTCTFFKAWDQEFAHYPKGSYLAPLPKVSPWLIGPNLTLVPVREPAQCWDRHWIRPLGV